MPVRLWHQYWRSSSILIFFSGYVWQTCWNQTKTFHTLIRISLDSPGAATQPCSRVNTFHWPLNCGISSMPYLRVQCETLSGQHLVGHIHSSQLLAEEKTSIDWWFNATWSQFNQIIHQHSSRCQTHWKYLMKKHICSSICWPIHFVLSRGYVKCAHSTWQG